MWKGNKIWKKSPPCFEVCSVTSKQVEDFDKFCGLFRKSELYLSTDCAFIFLNSVVYDKNVEVTARYDFWREVWCNKKPDLILIAWAHIYISYPLKRAQELWQLLKMANPLMVNIIISWKKNLEKSKEINIEFFRCFHQFFPRNFLSLSSWKQDALYYFI